jgi:hypothetical protein
MSSRIRVEETSDGKKYTLEIDTDEQLNDMVDFIRDSFCKYNREHMELNFNQYYHSEFRNEAEAADTLAQIKKTGLWESSPFKDWYGYCEHYLGLNQREVRQLLRIGMPLSEGRITDPLRSMIPDHNAALELIEQLRSHKKIISNNNE